MSYVSTKSKPAYYNEIDKFAAKWLRNLIKAGVIAPGDVDERSIEDVLPSDLKNYSQCHFFAGIGVWSRALRQAGWADERPVWTGSCPCQPFSAAGKGAGFADERHLWPTWHYLIEQCRPPTVFGEQVASKDGLNWLDLVHADMEASRYAFGAVDLCAAGVGSPHIRQRLWFVADSQHEGLQGRLQRWEDSQRPDQHGHIGCDGTVGGLANADSNRCTTPIKRSTRKTSSLSGVDRSSQSSTWESGRTGDALCKLADTYGHGSLDGVNRAQGWGSEATTECGRNSGLADTGSVGWDTGGHGDHRGYVGTQLDANGENGRGSGPTNGLWGDADWLHCRDGKWRPVEPGTFPLAHGAPGRVGRLRAYGNAINSEAAKTIISAYLEDGADEI